MVQLLGEEELTLSVSNIDALPAKEASIDRPGSRPEQREGRGERGQQNVDSDISWLREGGRQLNNDYCYASDRGPQTCEEKHGRAQAENRQ